MIHFTGNRMNRFQYQDWITYFESNDTKRLKMDFSEEIPLSEKTIALVFPSIQAFQKGEGSDGAFLMPAVERDIRTGGPTAYRRAMDLFIREENWHSAYLRAYMNYYGIEPKSKSALDTIFRRLRHLGGIKCEVTVLVTAEMIALTYYDALSKCTDSRMLKQICRQMLDDEIPHIMFQSYTLRRLGPGPMDILLRVLMMNLTLLFVWCAFHKVYQAGGYDFTRFIEENNGYLRQSIYLSRR